MDTKKFYGGKYWQEGQGLQLWQQRLMITVLRAIYPNDKDLFYTIFSDEMTDEIYGYSANYENLETKVVFSIEIIGQSLEFFGIHLDDKANVPTLCINFSEDKIGEGEYRWEELPSKLPEVKEWVEKYIPKNSENKEDRRLEYLIEHLFTN